jgi:glycosyltransferase involved in cell wall biosynthesis
MALVTHYWAPHVGGIETVAKEQAQRLADLGWHIEVFTTRMRDDAARSTDGKVIVRRYRCMNWQERRLRLPVPVPSPVMLLELLRYVRTADLVLAHGHCYLGTIASAHAARVTRRPLVVVQSSPFVDYPLPLAVLERIVDRTFGRWVLKRARIVICVSKFVEHHVRQIAPHASTRVIYSGVEIERFRPAGAVEPADPSAVPGSRPGLRVLTLRRLVPRNGVDVLITAWRSAALSQDATLTIAGSGPELARLKRLAAELASVRFLGHVPDEHLPDVYRSADLFVLPSVSGEGFGIAAAEALASGVPVIATTGGAAAELIRHGHDGLIVPARDPEALAKAIAWLAADSATLRRMAIAASQRRPRLSWPLAIEQLAAILDAVTMSSEKLGPGEAGHGKTGIAP